MSESEAATPGVAVFGSGYWGANHVRVWSELGHLRVVCDSDRSRLAAVTAEYPDVAVYDDPAEALRDPSVDAVVIATPAVTHGALGLQALQAGKHLLVEKPLATDVGQAELLVEAAEAGGLVLLVGHVLEYHPAVRALRALVSEGALGKVLYAYSNRLNFGRLRTEENAMWSFAPHDIALLLRIVGEGAHEVACRGSSHLSRDVADTTLMSVTFANGVQAHVFVSWLHPFKEQRFVVVGDQQMAVFDDTLPWEEKLILYPHHVEWLGGNTPVARKEEGNPVSLTPAEPLRAECEELVASIRASRSPLTDGRSGLDVLRVLDAGERSMRRSGEPIVVDEPPDDGVFVHPTAAVDAGAQLGSGTRVWHFAHVMGGARIGRDVVLGQNTFVGKGVRIGDRVKVQNSVSVFEGVELEDDVFCGPSMVFTNVMNPRAWIERKDEFRPTLVRRGASIGAGAVIVCGTTVGRYAFVGAGSVVTKDVADNALVVGNPARQIGWMCMCGVRLEIDGAGGACTSCGRVYRHQADGTIRPEDDSSG